MVVTTRLPKARVIGTALMLAGLVLAGLLLPLAAIAQQPAPRLSDAWLDTLKQSDRRVTWRHAFALEQATADALDFQRRRLMAELGPLVTEARLIDRPALAAGLRAWHAELEGQPALPARTPGRHDLPWLGAHQRGDLPLDDISLWGHCPVPSWVEVWHHGGVSRVAWRQDMTLAQGLAALPETATRQAETATLITPVGTLYTRGIAAWNHQATPLTPGSRVILPLPESGPYSAAARVVNRRLPGYLATRLPGDACEVFEHNDTGVREPTQ
ncbi:capsule biosynthesis GfcC family protein [Halomonas halodenitrificans]|uniref:capsule biosynthesis GfcC family protein n=1 Tax=Halomonas halodenitrificans TaxID=28252 RepID=UPI000480485C|nr:capsule biosynthesis GfcC family protein [Halomonas halodenitrificans]